MSQNKKNIKNSTHVDDVKADHDITNTNVRLDAKTLPADKKMQDIKTPVKDINKAPTTDVVNDVTRKVDTVATTTKKVSPQQQKQERVVEQKRDQRVVDQKQIKTSEKVRDRDELSQRSLIRQHPLALAFNPYDLPRSLSKFFHTTPSNLVTGDDNTRTFARYLGGDILTRDENGTWLRMVATPLQPNAALYHDVRQTQKFHDCKASKDLPCDYDALCHRKTSRYFQQNVCPDIIRGLRLSRWYPSTFDAGYIDAKERFFKLMRIVCDSYTAFQCLNDKDCVFQTRPFCNIQPRITTRTTTNNNVKATNKNQTKQQTIQQPVQQKRLKSAPISDKVIQNSIYDESAIACLARTHFPTPLRLALCHDYRGIRINNNTRSSSPLDARLRIVKSRLHAPCRDSKSTLSRRIANRDHSTLQLNTFCQMLMNKDCATVDNTKNNNTKNVNVKVDHTQRPQHQRRLDTANKLATWIDTVWKDTSRHTINTKRKTNYNALLSVRPIDIWSLKTWALQQKNMCSNCCTDNVNTANNPSKCECDIRWNKKQFARDISYTAAQFTSLLLRANSANRAYERARQHHKDINTCNSRRALRINHMLSTSVPWSMYFASPRFVQMIEHSRSNLRHLPQFWTDLQQVIYDNRMGGLSQMIKLLSDAKAGRHKVVNKNRKPNDTTACGYTIDSSNRKRSTWITPRALKEAKLRQVHQRKVNDWFEYLSHNNLVGHVVDENRGNFFDSILNLFR